MKFDCYKNYYDINTGQWGPYSKKYAGISHINSEAHGIRFDVSVFSAFFKQKITPLNHKWDSGFVYSECQTDLEKFVIRQELLGIKDIYSEHFYEVIHDNKVYVHSEVFNNTNYARVIESVVLININFAPEKTYSDDVLVKVFYAGNGVVISAIDYKKIDYKASYHTKNLTYDGHRRGEELKSGYFNGVRLAGGFGLSIGDFVIYELPDMPTYSVSIRICIDSDKELGIGIVHESKRYSYKLSRQNAHDVIPLNIKSRGDLKIISESSSINFYIDAIIISNDHVADIADNFKTEILNFVPFIERNDNLFIVKYDNTDVWYGVAMDNKYTTRQREFFDAYIERSIKYNINEHVKTKIEGDNNGHYLALLLAPINLLANASNSSSCYILKGKCKEDIINEAKQLDFNRPKSKIKECLPSNSSSNPYKFAAELLSATLLSNIIYPIRTRGKWIRHFVPGKWWDCLYTWDGGFIALGLLNISKQLSFDMINAYLTEPCNGDSAFIHHGSMVPVQFYVFKEYIDKTTDIEVVKFLYPRLRQYYNFAMGRSEGSSVRLKSGILRPFDYFYNSGGWDDYPAQVERLNHEGTDRYIAPVVTTAHFARAAQILLEFASEAGYGEDESIYKNDLENMRRSLLDYAWDDDSGYFSYTIHDLNGNYQGKLKTKEGENYNKGVDGLSPIFANLFDGDILNKILNRFLSRDIFTEYGISVVDKSACYYRNDGYWNGNIWMPYQWFFWKTLLDFGLNDEAYRLAKTGLDIWKMDTEADWRCREFFSGINGAGAGWNLFSGLSSPLLSWYCAYFVTGTVNVGFDSRVLEYIFLNNNSNFKAKIKKNIEKESILIVCMQENILYNVMLDKKLLNTKEIELAKRNSGVYEISLPAAVGTYEVEIINRRV